MGKCSESIRFWDFAVEPICTEVCPVGWCDKGTGTQCVWFTDAGAESYHCKINSCDDAPEKSPMTSNCWSWKGEHFYSLKKQDAPCQDSWHRHERERLVVNPPAKETVTVKPPTKETKKD